MQITKYEVKHLDPQCVDRERHLSPRNEEAADYTYVSQFFLVAHYLDDKGQSGKQESRPVEVDLGQVTLVEARQEARRLAQAATPIFGDESPAEAKKFFADTLARETVR